MSFRLRSDGPKYSFQVSAVGVFKTLRSGIKVVDYVRVTGAGSVTLRPKLPAEGHTTETFLVEAGHVIEGQWLELVDASPACFPIDLQGW